MTPERFVELWQSPETRTLIYRIINACDDDDVDRAYVAMIAASGCAIIAMAEKHGDLATWLRAFLAGVQQRTVEVGAKAIIAGEIPG
jgi:hypothetical protein